MKYDVISLDSLDTANMNLIKSREKWYGEEDHSRWVFEDNGLYYKIWNETYIRRDCVKTGIECGFYDRDIVPAFVGLIYYNNICRGYITEKCHICDGDNETQSFMELIRNKTKETSFFIYDITEKHVMRFKDRFSLIDLEGIRPLSDYEDIAEDRFYASFASEDYRKFVYGLYKNK